MSWYKTGHRTPSVVNVTNTKDIAKVQVSTICNDQSVKVNRCALGIGHVVKRGFVRWVCHRLSPYMLD